uniref:Uncharacterized protein n=1 Tax=Anguilla anguilla TaxID=7936 RepID=A0A0E9PHJ2_ANGAN
MSRCRLIIGPYNHST